MKAVCSYKRSFGPVRPTKCIRTRKRRIESNSTKERVSTSYVEHPNLTVRIHLRRSARLTNSLSKKVKTHAIIVTLDMVYYNLVDLHPSLRMSPAMAAGFADRL